MTILLSKAWDVRGSKAKKNYLTNYQNVKLSIENRRDVFEELLTLLRGGYIADGSRHTAVTFLAPSSEARAELRHVPGARVYRGAQARQFLHNCMAARAIYIYMPNNTLKLGKFSNFLHSNVHQVFFFFFVHSLNQTLVRKSKTVSTRADGLLGRQIQRLRLLALAASSMKKLDYKPCYVRISENFIHTEM